MMEDNSILLNGGHHLEVVVLLEAYPTLVRMLGGNTDRQEVLSLRSSHDDEGIERVAVLVGAEQVGYLPVDVDPGLLATVKACEINEAVPQARGDLLASWDQPGKVSVRVDLADPDDLLSAPGTQSANDVDGNVSLISAGTTALESAETPALSAGYTEDYPDWPPPRPESATDSGLTFSAPIADQTLPSTAPTDAPSGIQASAPSPNAPLATRSAGPGGMSVQPQAPQAGWLAATASATSQSSDSSTRSPVSGASSGAAFTPTAPLGQASAAQTQTKPGGAPANDLDSEIIAAWGSSGSPVQPVVESPVPSKPRMNTNWVIPTVVAVLAIAVGLLVWKFVFAPKTYTDPDYGYSFSYPGRWEVVVDSSMVPQFAYLAESEGELLDSMVLIGKGLDSGNMDEMAILAVARTQIPGYVDRSKIAAEMQSGLDEVTGSGMGLSIIEPAYPTTIGGLDAYKMTLSLGVGFYSMTMSYAVLLDGNTSYALMAAATGEAWSKNRKAFARFFDSFEPG